MKICSLFLSKRCEEIGLKFEPKIVVIDFKKPTQIYFEHTAIKNIWPNMQNIWMPFPRIVIVVPKNKGIGLDKRL